MHRTTGIASALENGERTGHKGLPPLDIVNASEKEVLSRLRQRWLQSHEATKLSHGLNLEHTGHDRPVGEVASKLGLVRGDALHTNSVLARHALENLVDQEERVSVRQNLADLTVASDRLGMSKAC